ncbi:hypothetical protein P153DRAFT_429415 [Dothidotthia symphoricarpi CBS 119687]|uniref:Uncharacterized protein n=1 Tax=Dothidotthia symphoricarpi CBS 119687 TaxID=1392245 RepID=A0A6A6AMT9_9PLEO|nr:uncharacterized protein P153DRAFT_429415 [Dothidotthia symphoricarpi CBS 119687]KAF2132244.1 hypothetical protein P153DRAFT_429415 [Dothidotthia symphoricarpi CBS 119687]
MPTANMAHSSFKRQNFSPSCPSGGTWWACGYGTYFVGCCARDPCDITCAQGNLYPGAFDPAAYGTFADATCGTGSKFYTCSAGLTFWGCCKTNACSQGSCPDGDLEPAVLNREDLRSAYHATGGSTVTTSTTSRTALATGTTTSTHADVTSTSSPSPSASTAGIGGSLENKPPVAAIAGGAAGGAFVLAVIVGLLIYYVCLAKKSRKNHQETVERRLSGPGPITIPNMNHGNASFGVHSPHDAPPDYTSRTATYTSPSTPQFQTYNHIHQPHLPEPQELPDEPFSSGSIARKPVVVSQFSELEGEMAIRSELDSPMSSPSAAQMSYAQQSPRHAVSDGKTWLPPKEWHARTASREKYARGVERQGWSDGDVGEYSAGGEAQRRQEQYRGYHGL